MFGCHFVVCRGRMVRIDEGFKDRTEGKMWVVFGGIIVQRLNKILNIYRDWIRRLEVGVWFGCLERI